MQHAIVTAGAEAGAQSSFVVSTGSNLHRSQPSDGANEQPSGMPSSLPDFDALRQMAKILWACRVPIAASAALPVILAIFYLLVASSTYTARSTIILDARVPQPLRDTSELAAATFDSPYMESQIAVISSETILRSVTKKLSLLNDEELVGSFASTPVADVTALDADPERLRAAISNLRRNLYVQRAGLSFAIDINYRSTDAEKAARIANAFADVFITDQVETRADMMRAGSQWLELRIDELRRKMNFAALEVQRFKAKRDYRIVDKSTDDAVAEGDAVAKLNPPAGKVAAPAPNTTLEELETTSQIYRKIYESYLQGYTESLQRQSFPMSNARVITRASSLMTPRSPKPMLVLALGLFMGLLLAAGQAFLQYQFRKAKT